MWISHCLNIVFGVYSLHKQHWLLPVTMKEKYASRIVFNLCQTIVLVLASALIIYWVRIPLAYFFSIEQPIERGWLLPLLAWYYRWPTVVFYLFEKAFTNGQLGYGSAVAVLLAIIIFIITAINFWGQDKWVQTID